MAIGSFADNGELWFEIQLVAVNGEEFSIEALLYQVRLIAYKSRITPPRFCLTPKPPLPLVRLQCTH
ncbi:MAG: hypothetical protein HC773_14395, partial [Scytonema sp. CRU_2_7]|nr:hypothetical protein [Scytonema sp. CRU_2_7]